jgi:hypothetical protein
LARGPLERADETMNIMHLGGSRKRRWRMPGKMYRGPVIWIVVLLAGWLVITEWPAVAGSVLGLTH